MKYLTLILLLLNEAASAETYLFTCGINGIDLKSFIYDHEKHSIAYSEKFAADNQPKNGVEKFKYSNITEEYLQLDRVYTGTKHKKTGLILESVYISRFTNYINTAPVLKAESSTFINNEYITSSSGKCTLSIRQF